MIDRLTTSMIGALFCVREYFGKSGLVIACKPFVMPMCKYGKVILWVPLLCTYTSWMQYKRQLRNCVRQHFDPCYLVTRPVSLAYCASCWIPIVRNYSRLILFHSYLYHTSPLSVICH